MYSYLFQKYIQYKHKNNLFYIENHHDDCTICFEEIGCEYIRNLPCKHYFHKKCLDSWMVQNNSCPICRDDLSVIWLSNLYKIASIYDIENNINYITKVIKHVHNIANKQKRFYKGCVCYHFNIIYFEVNGFLNVWNELNPNDVVSLKFVLKNKIYDLSIPTIYGYQTFEHHNNCMLFKQKYSKVFITFVLYKEHRNTIEYSKRIAFVLNNSYLCLQ